MNGRSKFSEQVSKVVYDILVAREHGKGCRELVQWGMELGLLRKREFFVWERILLDKFLGDINALK